MSESERRRGRPPHPDVLTPAEWPVLELVREGLTNADIAERLGVTVHAVKFHVSNMLGKAGAEGREELARWKPEPTLDRKPTRLAGILELLKLGSGLKLAATIAVAGTGLGAGAVLFAIAKGEDDGPASPEPDRTPALAEITPSLAVSSFRLVQRELSDIDTGPGSQRREIERTVFFRGPSEGAEAANHIEPAADLTYVVRRGAKSWSWEAAHGDVFEVETTPLTGAAPAPDSTWPYQPPTLGDLLRRTMAGQAVQVVGNGTVAGRPVMELLVPQNRCFTGGYAYVEGERRLWVDTETLFALKFEQRGRDGSVTIAREVKEVQYNLPLDGQSFALPPGRTIVVKEGEIVTVPTPQVTSTAHPGVAVVTMEDGTQCLSPTDVRGPVILPGGVGARQATATPTR